MTTYIQAAVPMLAIAAAFLTIYAVSHGLVRAWEWWSATRAPAARE